MKLCVGVADLSELIAHRERSLQACHPRDKPPSMSHVTRMFPQRSPELLDGGSLYWVIKGKLCARQRIMALDRIRGEDGISRCRIVLDLEVTATAPQHKRPFQGWRYLKAEDAPPDLARSSGHQLDPALAQELARLGLL